MAGIPHFVNTGAVCAARAMNQAGLPAEARLQAALSLGLLGCGTSLQAPSALAFRNQQIVTWGASDNIPGR